MRLIIIVYEVHELQRFTLVYLSLNDIARHGILMRKVL